VRTQQSWRARPVALQGAVHRVNRPSVSTVKIASTPIRQIYVARLGARQRGSAPGPSSACARANIVERDHRPPFRCGDAMTSTGARAFRPHGGVPALS
jgi:hypothetical protein